MTKFEITKLYGSDAYNNRPRYAKTDRIWVVLYGLAHIVDGLVILGSLTLIKTNFMHMVSHRMGSLAYKREKRRLAKHDITTAYCTGVEDAHADRPDFTNPYFNVRDELEDAWDNGWESVKKKVDANSIQAQFDLESG